MAAADTSKLTPEQEAGVEKIKKILSKIQHQGGVTNASEGEMDTALKIARAMMNKFNIDEGLFERLVEGTDTDRQSAFDTMTKDTAFSRKDFKGTEFFTTLAQAVTLVCDVGFHYDYRYLQNPQVRNGETHSYRRCIDFYGLPRDVAVAKALYQELVATMHAMARLRYGTGWGPKHNGYSFGLIDRLYQRAQDEKAARDAAPGTEDDRKAGAIVLSKTALLNRYKYDVLGYTRPLSDEERRKLEEKWEKQAAIAKAQHEANMASDPKYRKRYERAQAKAAKAKGPRIRYRRVDGAAYDLGHTDGKEISLGTNGIGRKPRGHIE